MAGDKPGQEQVPTPPVRAAAGAIIGGRERQEDSAAIVPFVGSDGGQDELLLLADGMGGHARGDVASRTAIEAFKTEFVRNTQPLPDRLRASLTAANAAIGAEVQRDPQLRGMGCTLIGAVIADGLITWISVGDSLLLECGPKQVRQINHLHSIGAEIDREVALGRRSAESAASDPQRHMLLSAVMGDRIAMIDEGTARLEPGALVLLASDGIETLTRDRIAALASQSVQPQSAIDALLSGITDVMKPDQDNTTIIAARVEPGRVAPRSRRRGFSLPRRTAVLLAIVLLVAATASLTSLVWLMLDHSAGRAKPTGAATDPSASANADDQTESPAPVNTAQPMVHGPLDGWLARKRAPAAHPAAPRPTPPKAPATALPPHDKALPAPVPASHSGDPKPSGGALAPAGNGSGVGVHDGSADAGTNNAVPLSLGVSVRAPQGS